MSHHANYQIKQLTKDELIHLYANIAIHHFPKDEYKPVSAVERLYDQNIYSAYGLFEQDSLVGYALFVDMPDNDSLLLDYFAILEEYRSQGVGSIFLTQLRDAFPNRKGIFIESEDPDFAHDEADKKVRKKRLSFYEKNNAELTPFLSTLFGVHYRVFYVAFAGPQSNEKLFADLRRIYDTMFLEKYASNVSLSFS